MAIFDDVRNIIVEQLHVPPEKVNPDAKFIEDLGADSLDTVELIMAFEEKFNIQIPEEDAQKLDTVGKAIAYLEEKLKAQ
jgi:acyl carrier protein|uniref:Acyl carrier protein n=1 Tax=candidate division WOR-3 bacterium TaxID=2052148 RepID=A0A7V3VU62_UNCW3